MLQLFLVALLLTGFNSAALAAELRLVPEPRNIRLENGRFPLTGTIAIAAPGGEEDRFAAGLLQEEIQAFGGTARVTDGGDGQIVLARDAGATALGEEGYRLEVRPRGVRISALTTSGIFYGVQTLRQMIARDGIPAATIEDQPALRWRGIHDDISRGPLPTLAALERRIKLTAEFKINLYALYSEHAVAFRSAPLLAPAGGALSAAELRELTRFAARHHVSVLIEQQLFGHLERALGLEKYADLAELPGSGLLAPAHSGTAALVESLVREVAPLGSAPFLHIGGDEVADLGKGQSRAMVEASKLGPAYFRRLRQLHDLVAGQGKRMMFWGDVAMTYPALLRELPADVVVASWEYKPHPDYGAWIQPFREARLDVIAFTGVSNWNRIFPNLDAALPNIRQFTRDAQRLGAIGQVNCVWADNGDAVFGMAWYPLLYGAAAAWQQGSCDPERFRRAFDWALFRNPGAEVAEAVARINRAHALVDSARHTDATLELAWLNPVHNNLDRRLVLMLEPVAKRLRMTQEEALELIERARPSCARNADLLDPLAFAARRLHAIGHRALLARRMGQLYGQALAAQGESNRAVESLKQVIGLLNQGREETVSLRDQYERLWLAENRPYWLGNVLAQFDYDTRVWLDAIEQMRWVGVQYKNGMALPTADRVNLAP